MSARTCMNCEGPLPDVAEAGEARCPHCGMRYDPEELAALSSPRRRGGGGGGGGGGGPLVVAVMLLLAAAGGVGYFTTVKRRSEPKPPPPPSATRAPTPTPGVSAPVAASPEPEKPEPEESPQVEVTPAKPPASQPPSPTPEATRPAPSPEASAPAGPDPHAAAVHAPSLAPDPDQKVRWDSVGGPPQPVQIAGAEHVLGRLRAFGTNELFLAAVAVEGAKQRWRVGPLTTYSEGYMDTWFVPAGDHVILSLPAPALAVLDLASGKTQRYMLLPAPVRRLWVLDDGRVGVLLAKGGVLLLDMQAGVLRMAPPRTRPPAPRSPFGRRKDLPAPTLAGINVSRTLRDGDLAVASGLGEGEIPRAVGFDPESGEARWTWDTFAVEPGQVKPDSNKADDLAHGRYVTVYGTTDRRWRLRALDASSGATLWDTELPKIFAVDRASMVVAGEQGIYVVRTSSVDVVRAKDGAYQGAIGSEHYQD